MRGTDVGCSDTCPFRIEPEIGQSPENNGDRSLNKSTFAFESSHCPVSLSSDAKGCELPSACIRGTSFLPVRGVAMCEPLRSASQVLQTLLLRVGFDQIVMPRLPLSREKAAHVLDDDPIWAVFLDGAQELGPKPGTGATREATTATGQGHVLAGEPAGADVRVRDGSEVDLRDVAVVWDVRVLVREHLRRGRVELREPRRLGLEHLVDRHAETTDASEQLT
jgi:hypothetical protein